MVLWFSNDDAIHHNPRHLDLARIEAVAFDNPFDLRDDDAIGIVHRHRDGESFKRQRLALHGKITFGVGAGAANDADIDWKRFVEQALVSAERHQLDNILGGAGIELATAIAWIDKRSDPDLGDMAGPVRGDIAKQMG